MTITRRRLPTPTTTPPTPAHPDQAANDGPDRAADEDLDALDADPPEVTDEPDESEEDHLVDVDESDDEGDRSEDEDDQTDGEAADLDFPNTYQAEFVGARIGRNRDPFGSTLLLTAADETIRVWAPLTPTTITALVNQLTDILRAQKAALGVPVDSPDSDERDDTGDAPVERQSLRERVSDPMGLRGLRDRTPKTPILIACAIAALLLLAFIGKLFLG